MFVALEHIERNKQKLQKKKKNLKPIENSKCIWTHIVGHHNSALTILPFKKNLKSFMLG